jgi:hypothetical protein
VAGNDNGLMIDPICALECQLEKKKEQGVMILMSYFSFPKRVYARRTRRPRQRDPPLPFCSSGHVT